MRSRTLSSVTFGGLAFGLAAASALAQQPTPAERPTVANSAASQSNLPGAAAIVFQSEKDGGYSAWVKVCEKNAATNNKEICLVNNETIDTNTGLTVIAAGVRKIEGDTKEQLFVTLPQTALLALPAGVRVNVDEGEPVFLAYSYCYGMSCEAATELNKELLGKLRKGKQMTVTFINLNDQAYALPVNLVGFVKAYDGPSKDAAKYGESRGKLIQAIRQRQAEVAAQAKPNPDATSLGEGPFPSQPQPVYPDGPPNDASAP